jgi:hypothetical protein
MAWLLTIAEKSSMTNSPRMLLRKQRNATATTQDAAARLTATRPAIATVAKRRLGLHRS